MHRSRQIIAIVVLASALAADGSIVASPAVETPAATGTFAGRLVERISANLHRTIGQRSLNTIASSGRTSSEIIILPADAMIRPAMVTPFQFRMPPPTV